MADALKIILIDDEPLAREEMRRLLFAHPGAQIVGEAGQVPEARALLARGGYHLVLLDIQLAGGSGFDVVPSVIPGAQIIFITAHDQFAVRAFEINALDYLLKPVAPARLETALARVTTAPRTNSETSEPSTDSTALASTTFAATDRIYLKGAGNARFVFPADIAAIVADDNYTEVFVADGERFLVRRSLRAWEASLPPGQFLRVHRQALVNLTQIERIAEPDAETPVLHVRGVRTPLTCSHRLSPELRRRLG